MPVWPSLPRTRCQRGLLRTAFLRRSNRQMPLPCRASAPPVLNGLHHPRDGLHSAPRHAALRSARPAVPRGTHHVVKLDRVQVRLVSVAHLRYGHPHGQLSCPTASGGRKAPERWRADCWRAASGLCVGLARDMLPLGVAGTATAANHAASAISCLCRQPPLPPAAAGVPRLQTFCRPATASAAAQIQPSGGRLRATTAAAPAVTHASHPPPLPRTGVASIA